MSDYDHPAYGKFEDGWEEDGISGNGLPHYRPVLFIRFTRPPLLDIRREATEEDIENYSEPYKLYQKQKAARDVAGLEGYPLVLWPALTRAEVDQCAGHSIFTVEQLAKLTARGAAKVPEAIMQLAVRAKKMIDLQGKVGKFEAIITQLTAERDQLQTQLTETNQALSSANATINLLQARFAGIGVMPPERVAAA